MRALRPLSAAAALVAPALAVAATIPDRVTILACAPGYPGTTVEAQPSMDALAAALARGAGLPERALAAIYLPGEAEGVARLGAPDTAVALLSLPFFLQHADALGLAPRLQIQVAGAGLVERWSLVARKGRVAKPADLAGFTILSIAGYSPDFVRGAPGAWGRIPDSAKVAQTAQVLSGLRKAAAGADVALLLDGAQAAAVPTLPFAADLEVVARSEPVPTSVVATVGKRLPAARWAALERGFLGLAGDPTGAAALASVRMVRFAPLDPAALAAARSLSRGGGR
ncbi:MAG TPA: PhnD/SsuA/transferrin family substrate-binding protein [Anaeromyxobacteraceae bacterium]|nr:PhnD/SsuA/transferrin family substrate-binding protein [Anaeromyxobacteraceae bacterium]